MDSSACEIVVPLEAVGRIIGKDGAFIKHLRASEGIDGCSLSDGQRSNHKLLKLRGSRAALESVRRVVELNIGNAQRQLQNDSRKLHNWTLKSDGEVLTPREVHRTGDRRASVLPRSSSQRQWEMQSP